MVAAYRVDFFSVRRYGATSNVSYHLSLVKEQKMKSVLPRLAEFGEEGSETDERIQPQSNKRHHNRVSFYVTH